MDFESWAESELSEIQQDLGLIKPRPNQSLFKYISLDSARSWGYFDQTINDLKLFGQSPNALNDPFELNPAIFNDISVDRITSILRISNLNQRFNVKTPVQEFLGRDIDFYTERAKSYLTKFRENSRVIALSERYDSPLLWAHYANSYGGACLHFLGGRMQVRAALISKVNYADQRPMYPLSLAFALSVGNLVAPRSTRAEKAETNKLLYFTKASDWAYEKEYRVVYNTNQITNLPIEPSSLVSIILGPKMPKKTREEVIQKVRASFISSIPIYRAKISTSNFSVQVEWAKPL